jgi:hypothetical protein
LEADDGAPGEHVARLGRDLTRGSTGDDVAELHGYLARYGYLPNPELSNSYPRWRPIVWESPTDPRAFDATTETAITALQLRAGLAGTGRVEGETRKLIEGMRCGVPEGVATLDRRNKFAHNGSTWSKTTLSWRITNFPSSLTEAQVHTAVEAAFASWQAETDLRFEPRTDSADIELSFAKVDGPGQTVASARFPERGGDITFDIDEPWSIDALSTGSVDIQSTALHQIGHSLGLTHTEIQSAAMYGYYAGTRRALHSDDRQGISALYDTWVRLTDVTAVDVAVSALGDVWGVVALPSPAPSYVTHLVGTTWEMVGGDGALNIAVAPDGTPWITDSQGAIARREATGSAAAWLSVPGCAIDIAVGANGDVWSVGCEATTGAGGIPQKWTGSTWQSVNSTQGALRITVDSHGFPWIVANDKRVLRRTSADVLSGTWQELPGTMNDLAIGPQDQVWAVGSTLTIGTNLFKMYAWTSAATDSRSSVDGEWFPLIGAAVRISAGPDGGWVVGNGIWQQVALAP